MGRKDLIRRHYEGCRQMGRKAAAKGVPYSDNPMTEGGRGYLEWSKGHNEMRAEMAVRGAAA